MIKLWDYTGLDNKQLQAVSARLLCDNFTTSNKTSHSETLCNRKICCLLVAPDKQTTTEPVPFFLGNLWERILKGFSIQFMIENNSPLVQIFELQTLV
jgi:hypothetical protein